KPVCRPERRMPTPSAGAYDEMDPRPPGSAVARVAATAVGVLALLYAPFVIAAGVPRTWDSLVAQASRDGRWWRLPFPDSFHGAVSLHPVDLKDLLLLTLPYVAIGGVGGALAV